MSPALANFSFEAANFLLLAAVLGWLLFKPVRRALDAERERRARQDAEVERLRAEAEALARDARAARETTEREAAERGRALIASAERRAAELLERGRKERDAQRHALERELATAQRAEVAALAQSVGHLAAESVRRLLETLHGPSLDDALVRAACQKLAGLARTSSGPTLVESARPLEPEARQALATALGSDFEERVASDLGAGVRVTTTAGQVDSTAVSLAARAARALRALGTEATAGTLDGP